VEPWLTDRKLLFDAARLTAFAAANVKNFCSRLKAVLSNRPFRHRTPTTIVTHAAAAKAPLAVPVVFVKLACHFGALGFIGLHNKTDIIALCCSVDFSDEINLGRIQSLLMTLSGFVLILVRQSLNLVPIIFDPRHNLS